MYLSLETLPMSQVAQPDPLFHMPVKRYEDGTYEIIPEKPEAEEVSFFDYFQKKKNLINNGDNIMEYIKILPIKASDKLTLFRFLEKRQAPKVVQFVEYIGLSDSHVKKTQQLIESFLENEGYQLSIRVEDYEREINLIEIERPTWTEEELEAQSKKR